MSLLSKLHINGVINLCREYKGPLREYDNCHITQYHVPSCDLFEPDFKTIIQAVNCIRNHLTEQTNSKIFIHCKAGRARSSCVVLCYLITCGYTVDDAMGLIMSKNKIVDSSIRSYQSVIELIKKLETGESFDNLYRRVICD